MLKPMCAADVASAALSSGALPALLCGVVVAAAAVSAAAAATRVDEVSSAPILRQRRRGARGTWGSQGLGAPYGQVLLKIGPEVIVSCSIALQLLL